MPAVNDVGEPCAGEPHARFDGGRLETEHPVTVNSQSHRRETARERANTYHRSLPPRQPPTLHVGRSTRAREMTEVPVLAGILDLRRSQNGHRGRHPVGEQ
jgi:hypothetical protein